MNTTARHGELSIPQGMLPMEEFKERPITRMYAVNALFLLHEQADTLESVFGIVKSRERSKQNEDTLNTSALDDIVQEKLQLLRDLPGRVQAEFARAIGVDGSLVEEDIALAPAPRTFDVSSITKKHKPQKPNTHKTFVIDDESSKSEFEERFSYFISLYGGKDAVSTQRRQDVIDGKKHLELPTREELFALNSMKKRKQEVANLREPKNLLEGERLFSGERELNIKVLEKSSLHELHDGIGLFVTGLYYQIRLSNFVSMPNLLSQSVLAKVHKQEQHRAAKSVRKSEQTDFEVFGKTNMFDAFKNTVLRESGLIPDTVLKTIEEEGELEGYKVWEKIFSQAKDVDILEICDLADQLQFEIDTRLN